MVGPKGLDARLGEIYPGRPPARVENAADHARFAGKPLRILHEGSACDVDLDCVAIQTTPCGETAVASNIGFYQLIAERREATPGDVKRRCEPVDPPVVTCREGYCLLPEEEVFERFPTRVRLDGGWAYSTPGRRGADRWWGGETEVAFPEKLAWPPPVPAELRRAALELGLAVNAWAPAFHERRRLEAEVAKWESALDQNPDDPREASRVRGLRAAARDALYEVDDPGERPNPMPPHLGLACDVRSDCVVMHANACGDEPVPASVSWRRAAGDAYERMSRSRMVDCEALTPDPFVDCVQGYCTLEDQPHRGLPARAANGGGFVYEDPVLQAPLDRWSAQRRHMRTPAP